MATPGQRPNERTDEEWTYLTSDLSDTACAICGDELRAGQAIGRVRDQIAHARCFDRPTQA